MALTFHLELSVAMNFISNVVETLPKTLECVIAGLAIAVVYKWTSSSLQGKKAIPNALPFPFNRSIILEIIYLIVMSKIHGDVAAYFKHTRKRVGDVFFMGRLFSFPHVSKPCLVILNPDDQAALVRKEKYLEWKVNMPDTVIGIHGERNFQTMPGGSQRHASLRKAYSSILSPKSLEKFATIIVDHFHVLWNDLAEKGEEVQIQFAIRDAQLKLMCELLYGFDGKTEEGRKLFHNFSSDFHLTEKALFTGPAGKKAKEYIKGLEARQRISKILNQKFDSIFVRRLQEHEDGKLEKEEYVTGSAIVQIVDSLIRSGCKGSNEVNGYNAYDDARENLYLLLEASHGTTQYVTTSLMFFMNHPDNRESLDRIRHEVNLLEPTYQNLKGFAFGEACIQETMRMAPIIGSITYAIPGGKSFQVRGETLNGPIAVQLNNSNWYLDNDVFESANSFLPERWISGEKEVSNFARSAFQPFGFGRHICLGYPLAKLVMAANLYCFASVQNRSIIFDEQKVQVEPGLFPEKKISDGFTGKVALS